MFNARGKGPLEMPCHAQRPELAEPPCRRSVISVFTGSTVSGPARPGPSSYTEAIQGFPGHGGPQSSTRGSDPRDDTTRTNPPATRLALPPSRDTEHPDPRQPGIPRAPSSGSSREGWIVGEEKAL